MPTRFWGVINIAAAAMQANAAASAAADVMGSPTALKAVKILGGMISLPSSRLLSSRRLMLPVSNDTLLRVVRRRARIPAEPLNVVGIDDWAWRRNHRYGTIVCDLERRRPIILFPGRERATAEAWLADHREIAIVARDRGGGYGEAVAKALPHAMQVADRWHLIENASRAFLDAKVLNLTRGM